MLQVLHGKEAADAAITIAARRASIVFAAEQWTYNTWDYDIGSIATAEDIEDTIRALVRSINGGDFSSSGRISVVKDELVGYSINLEIGSISEEEMGSLDDEDEKEDNDEDTTTTTTTYEGCYCCGHDLDEAHVCG